MDSRNNGKICENRTNNPVNLNDNFVHNKQVKTNNSNLMKTYFGKSSFIAA